ncbi:MAG: Jag N-terminal domain-containing protein, partial [Oscillospiraceae bacterium]|nr:Jag N-terminal domain-containing protein [Oscillospiraceae bacterium]
MAQSIEVSAKTIDAAIEKGLAELSLSREDVTVE